MTEMLGPYRVNDIVVGDCLDVMAELPDACIDLVMADPPYGEGKAEWDGDKPSPVIWPEFFRLLKGGGVLYYWGFWGHADWVLRHAKLAKFRFMSRIIWWFRTGRPQKKSYREDTETVWYFSKGEPETFNAEEYLEPYVDKANYRRYGCKGKHPGTIWVHSRILHNHPENVGHPTQKPFALIEKMISISSKKGDLVADFFMGSGTTAVAAEGLGRNFFGCDIDRGYVKMALKRLEDERQKRAQLEMNL